MPPYSVRRVEGLSYRNRRLSGLSALCGAMLIAAVAASPAGAQDPTPLLPDLDQALPGPPKVVTRRSAGKRRFRIAFASAVDNVGNGPLIVRGARPNRSMRGMSAAQLITFSNETQQARPEIGTLRYVVNSDHAHWHLLNFSHSDLRRASDFRRVRPDHKTGFCLGDRYTNGSSTAVAAEGPIGADDFDPDCGREEPNALSVIEGISPGFGDDYHAGLEGQYVDVTRIRPGRYLLVHRVNVGRPLEESNYANNASSMLLSIRRPGGLRARPRVTVLARCPDTSRCPAP